MRTELIPSIAIAGCGFGGIAAGIALQRAGIYDFTIYERAAEPGGVWRDNAYPGASCDVPSRLYSYSFEQGFPWSRRFAPQAEIQAYLRHCIVKYGLDSHIRCNAGIEHAEWDAGADAGEGGGAWRLTLSDGSVRSARHLISATGLFTEPAIPDVPGSASFEGPQFHTARWDNRVEIAGKNVAVIGTGASALQIVPAIAETAARVTVFQRSAQYVMPRADREYSYDGDALVRHVSRLRERWATYLELERAALRRFSARGTEKGGQAFLKRLSAQVPDEMLRAMLTPDYPLGCKRVLRSDDWFGALQRDDVHLVAAPVAEIGPDAVVAGDRAFTGIDVLVWATGFRTLDYLSTLALPGRDGRTLDDAWAKGAEAYLGLCVAGFPNFFMLYGPNTNLSGSIVHMLECQANWIARALRHKRRKGLRTMEVTPEAQLRFNTELQARLGKTVMTADNCASYFQTPSGRIVTQWPGTMTSYALKTRRVRWKDFAVG